jgi:hypothetical protein
MNKQATSQKSLGLPFWRLLVAAGCLSIVIGSFNVVAVSSYKFSSKKPYAHKLFQSFIFRDTNRQLTARHVRSRGAIALSETASIRDYEYQADPKHKAFSINTRSSSSLRSHAPPRIGTPPVDMSSPDMEPHQKSSRFSQFNFNAAQTFRNARQSVLPSYHSTSPLKSPLKGWFGLGGNNTTGDGTSHRPASSRYSRSTSGESRWPSSRRNKNRDSDIPHVPEISAPLNINPQFAHLVRPNLAHHPSVRRPDADFATKI